MWIYVVVFTLKVMFKRKRPAHNRSDMALTVKVDQHSFPSGTCHACCDGRPFTYCQVWVDWQTSSCGVYMDGQNCTRFQDFTRQLAPCSWCYRGYYIWFLIMEYLFILKDTFGCHSKRVWICSNQSRWRSTSMWTNWRISQLPFLLMSGILLIVGNCRSVYWIKYWGIYLEWRGHSMTVVSDVFSMLWIVFLSSVRVNVCCEELHLFLEVMSSLCYFWRFYFCKLVRL